MQSCTLHCNIGVVSPTPTKLKSCHTRLTKKVRVKLIQVGLDNDVHPIDIGKASKVINYKATVSKGNIQKKKGN